jgi:HSP20 family protein
MPARWRRITTRSLRVVSYGGLGPVDLLSITTSGPLVAPTTWRPAADLLETAAGIVLTVELAGVSEDDIDIALYPDAIIVSGNRRAIDGAADGFYHTLQIRRGPFHLEVPLPGPLDMERADATLENGMLRITIGRPGTRREATS